MTGGARALAIVLARGSSKGLPRKNVLPLGGRPLIGWTIAAAKEAASVARVIVSTDDPEIAEVATREGADVPFMRPPHLATDTATAADSFLHALDEVPGYEVAILLQPTSPLRTAADIDAAMALFRKSGASGCVSVRPVEEPPHLMYGVTEKGRLQALLPPPASTRRQDLPPAFLLNGAIYIVNVEAFRQDPRFVTEDTAAFPMPRHRSVDIDTIEDFRAAEGSLR